MKEKEKLLLLQLILQDLRGNWGYNVMERAEAALQIAEELKLERFINSIKIYISSPQENGDWDGRYFRDSEERGGYQDMEKLHGLKNTLKGKSKEFKEKAFEILTHPEFRFDDFGETQ